MTTRRQFVRGAGTASLFLCMPAIVRRSHAEAAPRLRPTDLPAANFPALRPQAQFDACIRPHRKGGVRLSFGKLAPDSPKYLIHNYGHSGAGITLSWGCAAVVVDYVDTIMNLRRGAPATTVAILGSGVIGLTTATELRAKWPAMPITIYAKGAPGDTVPDVTKTTSHKAGGQFEPSIIVEEYQGSNRALLTSYLRASDRRIRAIAANPQQAALFGIAARKNYTFDDENAGFDEFTPSDVVKPYRLGALPFSGMVEGGQRIVGREYETWLMNPRIMLPKLAADLAVRNVPRRVRTFVHQQDLNDLSENVIINCTGFGAKALFCDDMMEPRRGILVRLPNPQRLDYFFSGGCRNGRTSYLFARQNDLVIGGTIRKNQDSEVVNNYDRDVGVRLIDNIERAFNGHSNECVPADPSPDGPPEHACAG